MTPPPPIPVVAVASQKGGVGKTTVTLNLSHALAKRGWRTLVVDADPQGGIGLSLSRKTAASPGLADYVSGGASAQAVVIQTKQEKLAVLPAGRIAMQDTPSYSALLADGALLAGLVGEVAPRFDLVFLDTPSGFGGATLGALRAATHVISPVQAEPLAARSLSQLLEVLGALRAEGASVQLLGVVITMLQMRVEKSFAVADELWNQLGDRIFQTTVPRDGAFLDASAAGIPVGLMSHRPPAVSSAFDQLAAEVEGRLALSTTSEEHHGPLTLVD